MRGANFPPRAQRKGKDQNPTPQEVYATAKDKKSRRNTGVLQSRLDNGLDRNEAEEESVSCAGRGRERTCPHTNPLQRHGGKSHTTTKSMARDVEHCIGSFRVVRIQGIPEDDQNNGQPHTQRVPDHLLCVAHFRLAYELQEQVKREAAQLKHDGEQKVDGRTVDPAQDTLSRALFRVARARRDQ